MSFDFFIIIIRNSTNNLFNIFIKKIKTILTVVFLIPLLTPYIFFISGLVFYELGYGNPVWFKQSNDLSFIFCLPDLNLGGLQIEIVHKLVAVELVRIADSFLYSCVITFIIICDRWNFGRSEREKAESKIQFKHLIFAGGLVDFYAFISQFNIYGHNVSMYKREALRLYLYISFLPCSALLISIFIYFTIKETIKHYKKY